jgi:hypothetical protein
MPDFGLVCAAAEKRARTRDVNAAAGVAPAPAIGPVFRAISRD